MGDVMVIFKVFPDEPGAEDKVIEGLNGIKSARVAEIKKEPLAFGMFVVKAGFIIPDKEAGRMQALEDEVKAVGHVNEVEVIGTTLL